MEGGHSSERRRPRRRTHLILLAVGVLIIVALLAVVISFRVPIAESLLLGELQRRSGQTEGVAVSVTRFDRDHLALRALQIGDDLLIARLDARYSPTGLFASRLDSIEVSGMRLRGSLDASGNISFGLLDAILGTPSSEPSSGSIALPTALLELDDARIELSTPEGPLVITVDSHVSQQSRGQLGTEVEVTLEHRLATLKARLDANGDGRDWAGSISLDAVLSGNFGTSLRIGDAVLSAHPTFTIAAGQTTVHTDECVKLHIGQFEIFDRLRMTRPFELCIRSESISIDTQDASVVHLIGSVEPFSFVVGDGLQVHGKLPAMNIEGRRSEDGQLSGSLEISRGTVELPSLVGARGIRLEARPSTHSASSDATQLELWIDTLYDPQKPARFSELGLHATLRDAGASSGDAVRFDVEVADAKRELVIQISGDHEESLGKGNALLKMQPFTFCPGGNELTSILPILRGTVTGAQGSIATKGRFSWNSEGASGQVDVALSDLKATAMGFEIEHLFAAVSLLESGSPPGQMLSIGRIGFGLELTNGEILFQLLPTGEIILESAVWMFAGGELSTAGRLDPYAELQSLIFDARNVDLGSLLELVALDGLSGSGTLDGRLPLYRNGDRIEIRDAELHAAPEGGEIQYRPDPSAASVGAADDQFGTLLQILEDFHYTEMSLSINGDAAAEVVVAIHLEGSNPGYLGGQAVDFNLSVESRLSDLISQEGAVYQIPYTIEERFRAFFGPEVNLPPRPCVHPSEPMDDSSPQR